MSGRKTKKSSTRAWRSRIVGEADVPPGDLLPHPENWRTHPERQGKALERVLGEVGWVQRVVVSKRTGRLLDGHLRVERAQQRGEPSVPVLYVDVTEDEERAVLASLDPIAALATKDSAKLKELVERVNKAYEGLTDDVGVSGFRAGSGGTRQRVEEWVDADSFYAFPDWLAEQWEAAEHLLVQYSGGKDSTAVALWVAKHRREHQRIVLCFSDPGVEFPGMSAHIQDVAEFLGVEFRILKPERDWWSWMAKDGWPSLIYRNCATEFVHKPFRQFVKKLEPDKTLLFTGSRAEEAVRGSKKTDRSALEGLGKYQHFAPCFAARKATLEEVIGASGIPVWEGYSRGFKRTACWCCPGQCGEQALALQENYPGLAEDMRRWEKRLGSIRPLNRENDIKSFDQLVEAGRKKRDRGGKKAEAD